MKKAYNKPVIMFESFSMSTNIAGDCEIKIYNPNNTTCGYKPEGVNYTLFIDGISGCDRKVDDDGSDGYCYHVPIATNNLFNS